MMSNHSAVVFARNAFAIASFSASLLRPRNPLEAKRGSLAIFSRSISLQKIAKFLLLVAAMLMNPSDVGKVPIGVLVGWLLPSCGGIFLSMVPGVGWDASGANAALH